MNTPALPLAARIDAALRSALSPTRLMVRDDSALHAGHAGAREGGHYAVQIESAQFNGLARLARHRLVYHAVAELIPQGIHALAIQAHAPGEVDASPVPRPEQAPPDPSLTEH